MSLTKRDESHIYHGSSSYGCTFYGSSHPWSANCPTSKQRKDSLLWDMFSMPYPLLTPPVPTDWDGERQKEEEIKRNRECEERELKQKPITDPPSPQYTWSSKVTPSLSDALMPVPEEVPAEEEEPIKKGDKDTGSDYESDVIRWLSHLTWTSRMILVIIYLQIYFAKWYYINVIRG